MYDDISIDVSNLNSFNGLLRSTNTINNVFIKRQKESKEILKLEENSNPNLGARIFREFFHKKKETEKKRLARFRRLHKAEAEVI